MYNMATFVQSLLRAAHWQSAEPPKKKKKLDLTRLLEERERRKQKKISKIMEKLGPAELKPIEEFKVDKKWMDKSRQRTQPTMAFEESERRALLQKEWSRYKYQQHLKESQMVNRVLSAQQYALEQLKKESEELYEMAVECDDSLLPLEFHGPVETPALTDYDSPEGEYVDISKDF
ncbi:large ribosomal subunit protein mL40-like isoform X2 [Ptychodera flava]|uniref:large ribosomal subunit protein mL40-like isoform X2 n=1 Tax=Ptychodera flava TaxID=63121 RepID=UPI00396AB0EC